LATIQSYYLVCGSLEVQEGFSDQHAPASFRMTVLNFDDPSFQRCFLVIPTEKQPGRITPHNVLQNAHPLFNGGRRIGRKIVGLFQSRDLESGGTVCSPYATVVI